MALAVRNPSVDAGDLRAAGWIPGLGRLLEEGMTKITTQVERIDICSYPKLSAYYVEGIFPTTLRDIEFLLQFLFNCVSKLSLPLLFICRMNITKLLKLMELL